MSKNKQGKKNSPSEPASGAADVALPTAQIWREKYESQRHLLQDELVKLPRHFMRCGDQILVLVEGRDAAGKDGCIKRILEYLSPRETRVVALGKPSDRERGGWYFQRYVAELPVAEEFVLFNRSLLLRTHSAVAPWHIVRADDKHIVRADDKRLARLNLMRDMLSRLHDEGKKAKLVQPERNIASEFTPECPTTQRLAR